MKGIGLALLYPAREWSIGAPGHHGLSAHPIYSAKGPERPGVPPDHRDRFSIFSIQFADLGSHLSASSQNLSMSRHAIACVS
jgi:hypothetical protein